MSYSNPERKVMKRLLTILILLTSRKKGARTHVASL